MAETEDKMLNDFEWATKLAEDAANLPRLKDAFGLMLERYPLFAKQYRQYFLALTNEDFTPEQAMQIIVAHGWLPR